MPEEEFEIPADTETPPETPLTNADLVKMMKETVDSSINALRDELKPAEVEEDEDTPKGTQYTPMQYQLAVTDEINAIYDDVKSKVDSNLTRDDLEKIREIIGRCQTVDQLKEFRQSGYHIELGNSALLAAMTREKDPYIPEKLQKRFSTSESSSVTRPRPDANSQALMEEASTVAASGIMSKEEAERIAKFMAKKGVTV